MTTILLIRHGQSDANLKHRFAGHFDSELTELGHAQAECTAKFIKANYQVDKIYSSTLSRAYATAEHSANLLRLPVMPLPELREIFAGQWEGQLYDKLLEIYPEEYRRWRQDIGNACCTKGESVAELAERIYKAVSRIGRESEDQTVLVFTHATPVRAMQWKITGEPLSYMQQIPWVTNASVTEIRYDHGVMTLVKASQDAHLADLKTKFPSNV